MTWQKIQDTPRKESVIYLRLIRTLVKFLILYGPEEINMGVETVLGGDWHSLSAFLVVNKNKAYGKPFY